MTSFRCSDEARLRGDPLVGTAPPARRWLLVEQPGSWAAEAVGTLLVRPAVRARLEQAAAYSAGRILLIRRPGRLGTDTGDRAWCVVDSRRPEPVTWGRWHVDRDEELLSAADQLLGTGPPDTASPKPPPSGQAAAAAPAPTTPLVLLVCTHGRHDVCCAVRGRPVAAALARRWPEATWECSHVGGDRFAANVIVLPDGACYGGLSEDLAEPVVAAHTAGRPDPEHLRGVTGLPPAAQAAVVAAHRVHGPVAWGSVRPTAVHEDADGTWTVALAMVDGSRLEATVREEVRDAHRLTCRALAENRATVPVVTRLRTTGSAVTGSGARPPAARAGS